MEHRILVVIHRLLVPRLSQDLSIVRCTPVRDSLETGDETGEFLLPIVQGRRWSNDEERTPDTVMFRQVGKQRD